MAFDGITTACLRKEFSDRLTGARIYKIAQTDRDELVLTLKPAAERGGGQCRLYLSADASLPLCYFTAKSRQAPLQAPSFCMLLRKHLQNGRILSVTQPGLERVLRFEVEHLDEMGDLCRHTLVIELMGKHSNIIFLNDQEQIVDSIKHISSLVSSVREVLPGRPYFVPDTRSKKNPFEETAEGFDALMRSQQIPPARLLLSAYTGLSTQMAEELCHRAAISNDRSASSMTDTAEGTFAPSIYYKKEDGGRRGAPAGYAAVSMRIFTDFAARFEEVRFDSMSELLETFYDQKNEVTRIRQKSVDLRHVVQTILERDIHKYDLQLKQIRDTEKRDKYRIYGELLNAYAYSIPEGAKSCEVDNYYTGEKIRIPLDPMLTPTQNAKKSNRRSTISRASAHPWISPRARATWPRSGRSSRTADLFAGTQGEGKSGPALTNPAKKAAPALPSASPFTTSAATATTSMSARITPRTTSSLSTSQSPATSGCTPTTCPDPM